MTRHNLVKILFSSLTGVAFMLSYIQSSYGVTHVFNGKLPPLIEEGTSASPQQANAEVHPQQHKETAEWKLVADTLTSLNQDDIVEAKGNAEIISGNMVLRADFIRFFTKTNWAYLRGDISIVAGDDVLTADEGEFNTKDGTGWLHNGSMFISGVHMYVSGKKLMRHDPKRYSFIDAKFTTCDGDNPVWNITAGHGNLELDGYAHIYSGHFDIKSIGLVPLPYAFIPLKTKRQTGLIPPDVGYSSQKGSTFTQPFYWAINDTSDATFYASFMSHVGGGVGVEYRSLRDEANKSWLAFTYFNDRRDKWRENPPRKNDNRWWFRGMLDGEIADSLWKYKLDLDYVSDYKMLSDFSSGQMGYSHTSRALSELFHRTLREDDSGKMRLSQGLVYRDWRRFGFAASAKYQQNPRFGHQTSRSGTDTTVQILPQIDAFWFRNSIFDNSIIPLDFDARFTTGYMFRRNGNNALRTIFTPTLSMPFDFKYLSVIPSFTLHQTWYTFRNNKHHRDHLKRYNISTNPYLKGKDSTVPEINVKAFTEAYSTWNFNTRPSDGTAPFWNIFDGWTGLKHTVQPEIKYHFQEKARYQRKNPYFDEDDRMLPANEVTYSITHIFTRKKSTYRSLQNRPKHLINESSLPNKELYAGSQTDRLLDIARGKNVDTPVYMNKTANNSPTQNLPDAEHLGNYQAERLNAIAKNIPIDKKTGLPEEPAVSYMDILRWKLEWGYDFYEHGRRALMNKYAHRTLMEILNEVTFSPFSFMSLTSSSYYSTYTAKLARQDFSSRLSFPPYFSWECSVDYRTKEYNMRNALRHSFWDSATIGSISSSTHILKNTVTLQLPPDWYLKAYDYRNLRKPRREGYRGKGYEKGVIFGYRSQCWGAYVEMSSDGEDTSYSFNIEIPGLFETRK